MIADLDNFAYEFLEQHVYKKEVCAILDDHFYPVEVEQEIIPFMDIDKIPPKWLSSPTNVTKFENSSPTNVTKFENLVRKQEFYSLFYNLFFINFNNFEHENSDGEMNFFQGLEFNQTTLSFPIWKFNHKILLFVIFLPIGITWILVRNIFIVTVCRIFSWMFEYFFAIASVTRNTFRACVCKEKALQHLGISFVDIISLTFFIPLYFIAFVPYTFLWTIGEIFSWILAICFSFNLKPMLLISQGRMARSDKGLIKAKVGDGRIILKAKILSSENASTYED
jgi:hypothetical protein